MNFHRIDLIMAMFVMTILATSGCESLMSFLPCYEPSFIDHPEAYWGYCVGDLALKTRYSLCSFPDNGSVRGKGNVVLVIRAAAGEKWNVFVTPKRFMLMDENLNSSDRPMEWDEVGCLVTSLYFNGEHGMVKCLAKKETYVATEKADLLKNVSRDGFIVDMDQISRITDKCCAVFIVCGRYGEYVRMPYVGNYFKPSYMIHESDIIKESEDLMELFR